MRIRDFIIHTNFFPRRHSRSSMRSRGSRKSEETNGKIDSPLLAILYAEKGNKLRKIGTLAKHKYKYKGHQKRADYFKTIESMRNIPALDTTVNTPSDRLENSLLNEQLCTESECQNPFCCTSNESLDSTVGCCDRDDTPVDANDARHPPWNAEQTYIDAWKGIANFCCSNFNDADRRCRVCDGEKNAAVSDLGAETRAEWTAEYFYPEYVSAKGCRCSCVSSERRAAACINMQRDCCPIPTRASELLKNSAPTEWPRHGERGRVERFDSDEPRAACVFAPEFATRADEYSPEAERDDRCANCDARGNSACTIIRGGWAGDERARVLVGCCGGSGADLRDSSVADATPLGIDTRPGSHGPGTAARGRYDERPNKSDSQRAAGTWDARARRDCCVGGRRCGVVVAETSRPDRSPGEKRVFARGVDPMRKHGPIQTDAQQLDYKWKRRIATVDTGARASANFKGKRDSR